MTYFHTEIVQIEEKVVGEDTFSIFVSFDQKWEWNHSIIEELVLFSTFFLLDRPFITLMSHKSVS